MVRITLSVPPEIKRKMEQFKEMNWSGFVRKSIEEKTSELAWKEEMLSKLKKDEQFEAWCVEMGRVVNKGVTQRLKAEGLL